MKKKIQKKITLKSNIQSKKKPQAHDWRLCSYGQHWVTTHPMHTPPSKTHPDGGITTRRGHCAKNPSGKDQIYPDEMGEIAKRKFSDLKNMPCPQNLGFKKDGNSYDKLIAGWTQYWNEVLQPKIPLDSNSVKALIASESGFKPTLLADPNNSNSARGLMQINNEARKSLGNAGKEIKDHYVTVTKEELNDPSVNICAGIRWLFQKQRLASGHLDHYASWDEAIREYKGLKNRSESKKAQIMKSFYEYKQKLDLCEQ